MKKYVIKEVTYNLNDPSEHHDALYWGKPRRVWDSPEYCEGFKSAAYAERAIQKDIDESPLSERIGTHAAIENKTYIRLLSVVEIEQD